MQENCKVTYGTKAITVEYPVLFPSGNINLTLLKPHFTLKALL